MSTYTLDPAYTHHSKSELSTLMSIFLCIQRCSVEKFSYNERPLIKNSTISIFLLVVGGEGIRYQTKACVN